MNRLDSLYVKYKDKYWENLDRQESKDLRKQLSDFKERSEIKSLEDAKKYIELLWKFRKCAEDDMKQQGDNFLKTIKDLLAVGANGLYQDKLRFLCELIQNVDDCEYDSINDCNLEIFFDLNKDEIVLTYNEMGFRPFDVFAITGIAEAAKNIQPGKIEIGEKGIGFKSIFGIAERVYIKSGYFSFYLDREHFTIPEPVYDGYEFTKGTVMTVKLSKDDAKKIFYEIINGYTNIECLFNKNLILFLNKLTHLRIYYDSWRNIEFEITRCELKPTNKLQVEHDVKLKVKYVDNDGKKNETSIKCHRYTLPIIYNKELCQSRYGDDCILPEKRMLIQALVPSVEDIKYINNGSLYSFLPTKIKCTVPIALHAPFKLDAAREYVDDQEDNEWYRYTCKCIGTLLKGLYEDIARNVKEDIVYYLPTKHKSLILKDVDKTEKLTNTKEFSRDEYLKLKIFHTVDNSFESAPNVISIPSDFNSKICSLITLHKKWFIPTVNFERNDLKRWGIEIKSDIMDMIVKTFLSYPSLTESLFNYISENKLEDKISLKNVGNITLTGQQVDSLFKYPTILKVFNKRNATAINCNESLIFNVSELTNVNIKDFTYEGFEKDISKTIAAYISSLSGKCCSFKAVDSVAFFITKNGLLLSSNDHLNSFIEFCNFVVPNNKFVAMMKMSEFSKSLDVLCMDSSISNERFMQELRLARRGLQRLLGDRAYSNYIQQIKNLNYDSNHFINELLQNADDCSFEPGLVPSFSLEKIGNKLISITNEVGFTRSNVRALTAIGESTKKALFSKTPNATIGNKGVGFKSVFSIAKSVVIHSGEFKFKLASSTPTIPETESGIDFVVGTHMEFELEKRVPLDTFTLEKALNICLGLRKLKKLKLFEFAIEISDDEKYRKIRINDVDYVFRRYEHTFIVDSELIKEETSKGIEVSDIQSINCYAAYNKSAKNAMKVGKIYCGLPTLININVPLSVDGPFNLTTSRDDIIKNNWNDCMIREMNQAIVSFLESAKNDLRVDVLEYVKFSETYKGSNKYELDMFNRRELNTPELLSMLKTAPILPTKKEDIFVSAVSGAEKCPNVVDVLIKSGFDIKNKDNILDVGQDKYLAVLNGLGVKNKSFQGVLELLKPYINSQIKDEKFRESFIVWLKNLTPKLNKEQKQILALYSVIPVYSDSRRKTMYVQGMQGKICSADDKVELPDGYYILNKNILSEENCLNLFGITVVPVTEDFFKTLYVNSLLAKINNLQYNKVELYKYVMEEYRSGRIKQYNALPYISDAWLDGRFWLLDYNGHVTENAVFINDSVKDYFSEVVWDLSINSKCEDLAKDLRVKNIVDIYFNDIPEDLVVPLTNDDIEAFLNGGFSNYEDVINGYIDSKCITQKQIDYYDLNFRGQNINLEIDGNYNFPSEGTDNTEQFSNYMRKHYYDAGSIIQKPVTRMISYVKYSNGNEIEYNGSEIRRETIKRYNPDLNKDYCYCQMCETLKFQMHIEVNNIQKKPVTYLPELRIALCLECSKLFELYRNDDFDYKIFHDNILNSELTGTSVRVNIGKQGKTIRFTTKHLAEVKQYLKMDKIRSKGD